MSVWLSVCALAYLKNHVSKSRMKFSVNFTCGHGSVLWQMCNTLCTSGVMNNVMFSHNGANGQDVVFRRVRQVAAPVRRRAKLSTPNLVHIYSIAVAQHALTKRRKGQSSRSHGYENRRACSWRVLLQPCAVADRHGSACQVDCLCFLVVVWLWSLLLTSRQ